MAKEPEEKKAQAAFESKFTMKQRVIHQGEPKVVVGIVLTQRPARDKKSGKIMHGEDGEALMAECTDYWVQPIPEDNRLDSNLAECCRESALMTVEEFRAELDAKLTE